MDIVSAMNIMNMVNIRNRTKRSVRKTLSWKGLFLLLGGWILLTPLSAFSQPKLCYVHSQAPPGGDGLSWQTAFNDLSEALTIVAEGDELWIAGGSYTPSYKTNPADPRTATFLIPGGISLYGGFQGTEDLRSQRNWRQYPTTLTGDLQGDNDSANNSYHVVTLDFNKNKGSLLDGFIITGGNANGSGTHLYGGGIFASSSSLILRNSTIMGNQASQKGGALYNYNNKAMQLQGVSFLENQALNGGAIYNGSSVLEAEQCTFSENYAQGNGGAMVYESTTSNITNCTFYANTAPVGWGGGMHSFGTSMLQVVHATFTQNRARDGGALSAAGTSLVMLNSIVWGNEASASESQIALSAGSLTISHSTVQGGFAGGVDIFDLDPELEELGDNGGETHTCALSEGSPARHRGLEPGEHLVGGKPLIVPSEDQRGVSRPQGENSDQGAYAFLPPTATPTPAPTPTLVPAPTAAPTPTLAPTPTMLPTPTSAPAATPMPTETPTPAPSPGGTVTPLPESTPTPIPTPLPVISPTVAPSPSPLPSLFPSGTPLHLPALTVGALQGDLPTGAVILPQENDSDPEVQKLEEDLRNPQSPLRKALESFLAETNFPKGSSKGASKDAPRGAGVTISSQRASPGSSGVFTSLGAFCFQEIPLACLSSRSVTVPLTIFSETTEDAEEPFFFALLKGGRGEDSLSGESYTPIALREFGNAEDAEEAEYTPAESPLKILSCGFTLEDQKEHDTDPRPCFMSGAFVVLYAHSEREPLSGGSSGGCSGGYLPGMFLLGLPLLLLKP